MNYRKQLLFGKYNVLLKKWLLASSAQAPAKPSWAEVSLIISLDSQPAGRPDKVYSEQAKGSSELKFFK